MSETFITDVLNDIHHGGRVEEDIIYLECSNGDAGARGMLGRHVSGERLEQGLVVESVEGDVKTRHHSHHLGAELRALHVGDVHSAEEVLGGGGELEESAHMMTWCQRNQLIKLH